MPHFSRFQTCVAWSTITMHVRMLLPVIEKLQHPLPGQQEIFECSLLLSFSCCRVARSLGPVQGQGAAPLVLRQ